ncbi:DNA topoisomerase I [Rubinisphaera sp. JC750]|uniref:DNA topoisomerase I n=1 Tax=Rubinisphaera sp. JC750 TaxID=2898658 RepID=UPI001F20E2C4|nr:DNA topoisomerase I [Rubinisphaera sp. JC750]
MGGLLKFVFNFKLIKPILAPITRPLFRLLLGLIAIPIFRFICRRLLKIQELDEELEKDLEQWFKASLVLLAATKNMEMALFGEFLGPDAIGQGGMNDPIITGLRIMMAIGVIEMMPDQELFSIIHPGPPKLKYDRQLGLWQCVKQQWFPFVKGLVCQHLNRSSPVFAILCAIFDGPAGWICFFVAITQYLIIGLVTSKDRAMDALSRFDEQVAIRRQQLRDEFHLQEPPGMKVSKPAPPTADSPPAAEVSAAAKAESLPSRMPDGLSAGQH